MTPHIVTLGIKTETLACQKPGCNYVDPSGRISSHRHHMGSERMWLRHFKARSRSKRYRDFRVRYESFLDTDICWICPPHHEEVHQIYFNLMFASIKAKGYKKLSQWSWEEAEALMEANRKACREWLAKETPGVKPGQFVSAR